MPIPSTDFESTHRAIYQMVSHAQLMFKSKFLNTFSPCIFDNQYNSSMIIKQSISCLVETNTHSYLFHKVFIHKTLSV